MVFEEMSLVALKQYAKEKGMKGVSALKKSALIERLKEEQEQEEQQQEGKKSRDTKDTKEKKQKLAELDSGEKANGILDMDLSVVKTIFQEKMMYMYLRHKFEDLI